MQNHSRSWPCEQRVDGKKRIALEIRIYDLLTCRYHSIPLKINPDALTLYPSTPRSCKKFLLPCCCFQKAAEAFKKIKFETLVVSDTTRTIHRKLKIDFNVIMPLPRTVLIDNKNKIVWFGSPDKLNFKLLERFLRKEQS